MSTLVRRLILGDCPLNVVKKRSKIGIIVYKSWSTMPCNMYRIKDYFLAQMMLEATLVPLMRQSGWTTILLSSWALSTVKHPTSLS